MPAATASLIVLSWLHLSSGGHRHAITAVLSFALFATAAVLLSRNVVSAVAQTATYPTWAETSINSSAVSSSDGGTSMPSILAVCRLITSLNTDACWTG